MRHTYLTITFIFGIIAGSFSQANTFTESGSADKEATAILDKIRAKIDGASDLTYDFTVEIQFPEMPVEQIPGDLVQKEDKFVLKMSDQEIYSDAETMWVYQKDMNNVQIYDADFGEDSEFMSPAQLLSIYNSPDYTYAIEDQWIEGSINITKIVFKPLKEDSEYFKMTLEVADSGFMIKNLKVFSKDGTRYALKIHNITSNKNYNDDYFVLNVEQLKDIQVENLRID